MAEAGGQADVTQVLVDARRDLVARDGEVLRTNATSSSTLVEKSWASKSWKDQANVFSHLRDGVLTGVLAVDNYVAAELSLVEVGDQAVDARGERALPASLGPIRTRNSPF